MDLFYRNLEIDHIRNIDEKNRSIEISFSSEHPVKRYFGNEILLHGKDNVDLEYLNTVGSVLSRHRGGIRDIVGPIHEAWLDGRKGCAKIGFDDDELGNLAFSKVKSKSLRGISFGYNISRGKKLVDETEVWTDPETNIEYKGPSIIGTRWSAHEITLTPVPADHTVGFNRSLVDAIIFEDVIKNIKDGERKMDEKEIVALIEKTVKGLIPQQPAGRSADSGMNKEEIADLIRSIVKEESTPKIQVDRDTLANLSGRAAAVSETCKAKVFDMALDGRSHIEMLNFISDEAVKGGSGSTTPGAGNGPHDRKGGDDGKYRSIDDIPDDMFSGAFRS